MKLPFQWEYYIDIVFADIVDLIKHLIITRNTV